MRIIPVSRPQSKPVIILFVKYESEASVEWFLREYSMVCWWIIFSKILETIGRSKIGLKFLGSVLVPFLYKGLSLATLQSFGK